MLGFLDGLKNTLIGGGLKRAASTPTPSPITTFNPQAPPPGDGLLSAMMPAQMTAQTDMLNPSPTASVEQDRGLLGGLKDWGGSDAGKLAIFSMLRTLGGDEQALSDQLQIAMGSHKRGRENDEEAEERAALNGAFGPDGQFDPAAFRKAGGDAQALIQLQQTFGDDFGFAGDTPYTRNRQTNALTYGEPRPMSSAERLRERQIEDMDEYRAAMLGFKGRAADQADQRIGLSAAAGQRAAARGAGGGARRPAGGGLPAGIPSPGDDFAIVRR